MRPHAPARTNRADLLALSLPAIAAALLQARSYDFWWHLKTGGLILESLTIPGTDPFSFTSGGASWVDHGWLFQAALFLLYAGAGAAGLAILKAAIAGGIAFIGYGRLRIAGAGRAAALSIAVLALYGLRPRLAERPESVSMLMAALVAAVLLDLAARPRAPALRLAGLTALTAVWANLHAGALLVPAMAALAALGAAVERLVRPRDPGPARLAVRVLAAAMLLSAAGLLLNPWGYRLYLVPLQIGSALAPANLLNPEWLAPTPGRFPLFFTVAAVCALIAMTAVIRRRPTAPSSVLIVLMVAGMGLSSVRHIGLFFAVLPVAAARLFAWRDGDPPSGGLAHAGGWALCGVAAIVMVFAPPAGAAAGIGVQPGRFPEKAADFIDNHLPDVRLYNDVAFGGYLIWRGYPRRQVFIDGRNEVHGPLLEELSAALDDGARWSRLLDRHGVEGAVIGYREDWIETRNAVTGEASRGTFSELHFPRNGWALVYWDDLAMVFVRRGGRHHPVAVDLEYRWIRPEAFRLGDKEPAGGPGGATGRQAAGEAARKLEEDAACLLALEMATVYGVSGPSTAR